MDIEWGKDGVDGKLYILQARPETVKSQQTGHVMEKYRLKQYGKSLTHGRAIGQKIGAGQVRVVKRRLRDAQPRARPATCSSPT
jgi:pyruvate,water dikinase